MPSVRIRGGYIMAGIELEVAIRRSRRRRREWQTVREIVYWRACLVKNRVAHEQKRRNVSRYR